MWSGTEVFSAGSTTATLCHSKKYAKICTVWHGATYLEGNLLCAMHRCTQTNVVRILLVKENVFKGAFGLKEVLLGVHVWHKKTYHPNACLQTLSIHINDGEAIAKIHRCQLGSAFQCIKVDLPSYVDVCTSRTCWIGIRHFFFCWKRLTHLLSRTETTAQRYLWLYRCVVVKGIQIVSLSFIRMLKEAV